DEAGTFRTPAGPKPPPLMRRKGKGSEAARDAENELVQALELPDRRREGAMGILLPRQADGPARGGRARRPPALAAWLGALERGEEVAVTLPRFRTTRAVDLAPHLRALGAAGAFSPGADFSGIDGARDLFLTDAFHKAFVEVNEEGTAAAAA